MLFVVNWIIRKVNLMFLKLFSIKSCFWSGVFSRVMFYQCPSNLEYLWNFGSLAGFYLLSQFLSGLFLVFWYIPTVDLAFFSIEFIMREVNFGWLFRYVHANGASFFFIALYFHIARNLFFGSFFYPRERVWLTGMLIFLCVIFTAFLGYVLPWGQMSYWAATVISNLVSVIPIFGDLILIYLWGALSIDQPTLTRIYGLHFFLPFLIVSLVVLHIVFLYEFGSNNPLGIFTLDFLPFFPYFFWKDIVGFLFFFIFFYNFIFFKPNYLGHTDNYIVADYAVTPLHIVPEWYFLPFYGILRSIPNKVGGVLCLAFAIAFLVFLPYLVPVIVQSAYFRPAFQYFFFIFIFNAVLLGWCGGKSVDFPFYEMCQISTFFYFTAFLFFYPLFSFVEFLCCYVFLDFVMRFKN